MNRVNRTVDTIRLKYLKKLIKDDEYFLKRMDFIENKIYQWKSYYNKATTNTERMYCNKMINMYLKRLIYYIYR